MYCDPAHTEAAHTDPVFPPSAVTCDISRTSHVTHGLISYCPQTLTWDDVSGLPRSAHSSFHPRQWPPASGQTGPSVKSDPISKPFVKTFYVQQFLFVFVVRHSSSVPLWSHVPWLGHLGQKSQASSVSVTPGQIFIETRSQKCAILWPLGSLSEN